MKVWCVWTESGSYEDYSRDLRGIFATKRAAEAHVRQLGNGEIIGEDVLRAPPKKATHYERWTHVFSDGTYESINSPRPSWETWENEEPVVAGSIESWGKEDEFSIEVHGRDRAAVTRKHKSLLLKVREMQSAGKP